MDAWNNGEYLSINDKMPNSKQNEYLKKMFEKD